MIPTMGEICSSFVANQFPNDPMLLIASLWVRARGIRRHDIDKSDYAAKELLHAAEGLCQECSPSTPSFILIAKCEAHKILGNNAISRQDPLQAIDHLSTSRDLLSIMDNCNDSLYLSQVEFNIAKAKAILCGTETNPSNEKILQLSKKRYEMSKGNGLAIEINSGMIFARALFYSNHLKDAEVLLVDILKLSSQVHGRDHLRSNKVKSLLDRVQLNIAKAEKKKSPNNRGTLQHLMCKERSNKSTKTKNLYRLISQGLVILAILFYSKVVMHRHYISTVSLLVQDTQHWTSS